MSEPNEWESQLSNLLKIAAGQPQRQVTTAMVRRRLIRRRVVASAAAAGVVVLLGGIGAAVAATTNSVQPAGGTGRTPGVPSYYVQQTAGHRLPVVRSRITGAVTATVRCPRQAQKTSLASIASASHRTFFIVCQQQAQGTTTVVTASRIYRFRLTTSGRIRGYALVRGGSLQGLTASGIAATADGSELAVTVGSGQAGHGRTEDVLVINTKTGGHRRWLGSSGKPGTIKYRVGDMSLTADGRELAFLTQPRCVPPAGASKCHVAGGQEVRALSVTAKGGQVSHSRLLVKQSSLMRIVVGYINAAVISPDGSRVAVAEVGWPAGNISVVQVSAATGKQVSVVYRLHTGDGFSYRAFAADPSVRYFILAAGPPDGAIPNGWIAHGKLHRLRPFDGGNVFWEVW